MHTFYAQIMCMRTLGQNQDWGKKSAVFAKWLLCARHYARCSTYIFSSHLHNNSLRRAVGPILQMGSEKRGM